MLKYLFIRLLSKLVFAILYMADISFIMYSSTSLIMAIGHKYAYGEDPIFPSLYETADIKTSAICLAIGLVIMFVLRKISRAVREYRRKLKELEERRNSYY